MRVLVVAAVTLLLTPSLATADDEPRWTALVDSDVFTLFGSVTGNQLYSLHAGVRPPSSAWGWTLGFFGGWLPDFYTELVDQANGDDNSEFRVREDGVAVRGLHLPPPQANGFFYGLHIGVARWTRYHAASGGELRSNQAFVWPLAGYRWFPGGRSFFLNAWVGPGLLSPGFGEARRGPRPPSFHEPVWLPFAAIHAGFEL